MVEQSAEPPEHYEESSDEEATRDLVWLLGFVEPPLCPTDLLRHRFPSKVGGRPAWLDPVHLPKMDQLTCPFTGKVMRFLMQASYACSLWVYDFSRSIDIRSFIMEYWL